MPTSVTLSPHFEAFIRDQIVSGRYNNTSEVVRAALRLMEEQQQRRDIQLKALKAEIAAGKASGSGIPADTVFARLEAKYQQQADS
jgi:antitoxin ParD1/3/4